jgi:hypothetical protein
MPVFAVIAKDDAKIQARLTQLYPAQAAAPDVLSQIAAVTSFRKAWDGLYFVFDEMTSQQLGEKLGIADGSLGYVFIATIANYWGWGPKDAWEFLSLKRSPKQNDSA